MDWMKQLLPVLQAGLKIYSSQHFLKKSSENVKAVALQSSAIAFGSFSLLILFVASIIVCFVDLGNQLEAQNGTHFSGLMQSSVYMFLLGLSVFGISLGIAKLLAARERGRKKQAEAERDPYEPLIQFGEELLKQILVNLNQKESSPASAPASTPAPKDPSNP